jgi:hypothetical protein
VIVAFGQLKAPKGLQVVRFKAGSNVITVDSTINMNNELVDFVNGDSSNVMRHIPANRRVGLSAVSEDVTGVVLITVGDTTVSESLGRIVYKTSDNHFYGCIYVGTAHPSWKQLDN